MRTYLSVRKESAKLEDETLPAKPKKALSGEQDFIAENTRLCLVRWADRQCRGFITAVEEEDKGSVYFTYAVSRGWLTSKEEVSAAGFKVAAAYLRR